MPLIYKVDARAETLWTDSGKTTQATNGAAIAVWSPNSGTVSTDATQTTSGQRPAFRTNFASSGKPAVEFDGVNDCINIAYSASWQTNAMTIICALRLPSIWGTTAAAFSRTISGGWNDGFMLNSYLGTFGGGPAAWGNGNPLPTSGAHLIVMQGSNATGWYVRYGIRTYGFTNTITIPTNSNPVTLGARTSSGDLPLACGMHCFEFFDEILSYGDLDARLYAIDQEYSLGQYTARASGGVRSVNIRGGADQ